MKTEQAIEEVKKLPFAKSWQNNFVSKSHSILDIDTGEVKLTALNDFIFLPAPLAIKHFSNNRNFLSFRNEHKNDGLMDFKLLTNPAENENARIALLYIAIMLAELKIYFRIDNKYGIFIEISELHKKAEEFGGDFKLLYRHFAIPKQIAHKNGIVEQWIT